MEATMRQVRRREVERLRSTVEPDPTFRRLVGELAWRRLRPAIRDRFSWKPMPGGAIRYQGVMAVVRCSLVGAVIARLCRLIGTPLAPYGGDDVPATVTLRAADRGGIVWERLYHFAGRPAIRCLSVKRASAEEGLLECVGGGIGMWLSLAESGGALHFRSTGYFWRRGPWRLAIPSWFTPGVLHVVHADLGGGRFRFRILVRHPLFGETFFQDGIFAAERS
jgi:hypothetical protein